MKKILNILKKCNHDYYIERYSNAIQINHMFGNAMRLCMMKCRKCGKLKHEWVPVNDDAFDKIKSGKLVLIEWEEDVRCTECGQIIKNKYLPIED